MGAPLRSILRRDGLPLGKVWGIPVFLAYSWFLVAIFTVVVFGPLLLQSFPYLGASAYGFAFFYALLLLGSVLIHELAHALVARVFHWPAQKIVLNLWGGHTQFEGAQGTPWSSLAVALAGPGANFVLAGMGWMVCHLFLSMDVGLWAVFANIFVWANFLIAFFNILPGLPLDGGRLVESFVWSMTGTREKGTLAAGWAGRLLVLVGGIAIVGIFWAQGRTVSLQGVLLGLVIAGFLWFGASQAIKSASFRLRLPGIHPQKLAAPALGLDIDATVAHVLSALSERPGCNVVLCYPGGQPGYVVDPLALASTPVTAAASIAATSVSRPIPSGNAVAATLGGQELVEYLAELPGNEYVVVDPQGRVSGVLRQQVVVAAVTGKPLPQS